ncbi:MAG: adenylate/guanylate cyclase domain-containing protein [Leptospirales bacterium]|nr:adenylate/guanylate cyclase domain-containing protein [Leptospirales bacterium]
MLGQVNFRNAHSLHHGVLPDFPPEEIATFLAKAGVKDAYVAAPSNSPESNKALKEALQRRFIKLRVFDVNKAVSSHRQHLKAINTIHASLRSYETAVLYHPGLREDLQFFLSTLLLNPEDTRITAAHAVQIICGHDYSLHVLKRTDAFASSIRRPEVPATGQEGAPGLRTTISHVKPTFTIRTKLFLLTGAVIISSLTAITLLATYFFKKTTETMIQEYNLSLARLIGIKVESDLKNMVYRADAFAADGFKDSTGFFEANHGIVFVRTRTSARPEAVNAEFLADHKTNPEELSTDVEVSSGRVHIQKGQAGNVPLLLVAFESARTPGKSLILGVHSSELLEAFRTTRQTNLFQLFLLDDQGNFLLSTGEPPGKQGRDLPIVKQMLESVIDNGSQRFAFQGTEYLGAFQSLKYAGLGIVSTVESDRVFEAVYKIQSQNIKITLIILCLAFLGVFYFARGLTVPIVRLVAAMRKVERGDYRTNIRPASSDEVGILTSSFLSMSRGLEEREKIKEAFGKFVHEEVAEIALRGEIKLGGETRKVAILFSDLRNFTGISENLPPERVVELMNHYFSEMVECVYHAHGVVDKFIGDAIMAHWGAFRQSANDTMSAIDAALMMRERLLKLNADLSEHGYSALRFGVGINSGEVIAGQIGSRKRLEYTVIGDAVNLASRIEYLNKGFGTDILISEAAMQEAGAPFRLVKMPATQIRGKAEPQIVYAVLGRLDDSVAPKTLDELRTLVGIPKPSSDPVDDA